MSFKTIKTIKTIKIIKIIKSFKIIIAVVLLCACGKKPQTAENDAMRSRREALAEFRTLVKERDQLQLLAPGVFYRVLREGDGVVPTDTGTVTVHYEGRLKTGQVFDSSYDRNEPWTTRVDGTIPGWRDVLTHMPCGSKWFVLVYFDKAYGDQSVAGIPPMSNLYFTMELVDVKQ